MSEDAERQSVTLNGQTLTVKETELYAESEFHGVSPGIYLRVELLYDDAEGNPNAVLSSANGTGPEVDVPAEMVTAAIGSKLSRKSYDPTMHD